MARLTPALCAISRTEVPSKPLSPKSCSAAIRICSLLSAMYVFKLPYKIKQTFELNKRLIRFFTEFSPPKTAPPPVHGGGDLLTYCISASLLPSDVFGPLCEHYTRHFLDGIP